MRDNRVFTWIFVILLSITVALVSTTAVGFAEEMESADKGEKSTAAQTAVETTQPVEANASEGQESEGNKDVLTQVDEPDTNVFISPQANSPIDLSQCRLEITDSDDMYNGFSCYPSRVKLYDPDDTLICDMLGDSIYEGATVNYGQLAMSFSNNIQVGTNSATMTLTAQNSDAFVSGSSVSASFSISRCDISTLLYDVIPDQDTLGATPVPTLTVGYRDPLQGKYVSKDLVEGTDFRVVGYSGNDSYGDATVTVEGIGNFFGTREIGFSIGKSISGGNASCWMQNNILTEGELAGVKDAVIVRYRNAGSTKDQQLVLGTDYTIDAPVVDQETKIGYIVIRGTGDYVGQKTMQFLVVDAIDLEQVNYAQSAAQTLTQSSCAFFATGSRIEPEVASVSMSQYLSGAYYSRTISKADYVVSYGENTEPGKGTVTLSPSGSGVCKGQKTCEFQIVDRSKFVIDGSDSADFHCEIAVDPEQGVGGVLPPQPVFPWRGDAVEPYARLNIAGNLSLVEGRDYALSYTNNNKPGVATVTATGINGVTGSVSCDFQIADKIDIATLRLGSRNFEQQKYEYTGRPICPKLRHNGVQPARDIPHILLQEGDYTLSYENNVDVGTCLVTVSGAGDCYTGSVVVQIPIVESGTLPSRPSLSDYTADPISPVEYTGERQRPEVVLRAKDGSVCDKYLYTVIYEDNLNVGTAHAYVSGSWVKDSSGVPAMTGSTITVPFQIVAPGTTIPKSIEDATVTVSPASCTYDKKAKRPTVTVVLGGLTLVEGTDYDVSYKNNVEPGTATVTVTGKGGYTGTKSASFKIVKTGWVKEGSDWYYYGADGSVVKGWQHLGGKWYYLDPSSGAMATGWRKTGGKWYFFDGSGAMLAGWQKLGGTWYYFDGSGAMATGWLKLGSTWYCFAGSGAMLTGWQKVGSAWYYFAPSGAMATGWLKLGSAWYYFASSGAMKTSWQKLGGKWYYFASSGAMKTGWLKLSSTWYYFSGSGVMLTGRQSIGGKWYTFNSSGAWVA